MRFLLRFLILAALPACARLAAADIAVIVHSGVPVNDLSFSDLRQILLGDRQYWGSSVKVTLLVRSPVARERDAMLRTVLQMSEAQFRQYWIGKVFRAEAAAAPRVVNSEEETASMVASTPGSLSFLDAARVPKGTKIVRVDGKLPGEAGYRLR